MHSSMKCRSRMWHNCILERCSNGMNMLHRMCSIVNVTISSLLERYMPSLANYYRALIYCSARIIRTSNHFNLTLIMSTRRKLWMHEEIWPWKLELWQCWWLFHSFHSVMGSKTTQSFLPVNYSTTFIQNKAYAIFFLNSDDSTRFKKIG